MRIYISPFRLLSKLKNYLIIKIRKMASKIVQAKFMGCELLVNASEDVGKSILVGKFELKDIEYFLKSIKRNDVVVDIGANLGVYSIVSGRNWPDARIFAFEPVPINASLLRASLLLNRIGNVHVIQKCVSNIAGEVAFSVSSDSAYSSMRDTRRRREVECIKCEAIRLDEFCDMQGVDKVDVVKIDVEGAEELVILGAGNLFSDPLISPRLILIELYDENLVPFNTSIEKILPIMLGYRYTPFVLVDGRKTQFQKEHYNKYYNVFFEKLNQGAC